MEIANWINEERRKWDASAQLRKLMQKYSNCPDLISKAPSESIPLRSIVQKGKAGSGAKKRKFYLLSDFFLVSQPSSGASFEAVIDIRTAQVSDASSSSSSGKEGTLFTVWHVTPQDGVRTFHLECSTVEQKRELMQAITNQIAALLARPGYQDDTVTM